MKGRFYPLENDRKSDTCPTNEQFKMQYDERYKDLEFSVTEYQL